MEKIPTIKQRQGCEHNLTRKLYFQRGGKWVTTDISICDKCQTLIKNTQEEIKDE